MKPEPRVLRSPGEWQEIPASAFAHSIEIVDMHGNRVPHISAKLGEWHVMHFDPKPVVLLLLPKGCFYQSSAFVS